MAENRIARHHLGDWLKELCKAQVIPKEDLAEVARDLRKKLADQLEDTRRRQSDDED
jgi:hypothetical protein